MNIKLYSIKDTKVGYLAPYTQINDEVAKRNFLTEKTQKNSMISIYPEDFELWKIGEMNEKTGEINQEESINKYMIIRGDETI